MGNWRHEDEEGRGGCCSVITFSGEEGEKSGCFLEGRGRGSWGGDNAGQQQSKGVRGKVSSEEEKGESREEEKAEYL